MTTTSAAANHGTENMTFPRPIKPLIGLMLAAWFAWWLSGPWRLQRSKSISTMPPTSVVARTTSTGPYLGAASCAAAPCHGGTTNPERPAWNSAFSTWRANDPHARAYTDLLRPRGRAIAELYFADEPEVRPEQDQRCLACHLTPQTPHDGQAAQFEGVGCESCHGPSREWRDEHYLADWKVRRASSGFHDLSNLTNRARACVGCHVGAPGQEVNHQLIAAGHPPLRFELGAYHEQLPKHWDFAAEKAEDKQLEARLWLAGQMESTRAALELTIHRATTVHGGWPEFAEFDCESCHHRLGSSTWRQPLTGKPPWATWYSSPRLVQTAHVLLREGPQSTDHAAQWTTLRLQPIAALGGQRRHVAAASHHAG